MKQRDSQTLHQSPSAPCQNVLRVHLTCALPHPLPQAGNGVYEFTDRVHPGGGDTFTTLCAGNGRTKGEPLKTVNWLSIPGSFHSYVWDIESSLVGTTPCVRWMEPFGTQHSFTLGLVTQCVPLC